MNQGVEQKLLSLADVPHLDLGLFGWRPARTEHLLGQVKADSGFAFVLRDGEVVELVEMALEIERVKMRNM